MQEIKAGDLASILPKVAAGFAKNVNPVLRNDVALKLFGKSGGKLIDMFAQGKISMEELMKEAVKLGIITTEETKLAEAAADAWLDFTKAMTGVKNSIYAEFLPAVEPALKAMKEWVLANKTVIKEEVTKFVTKLGEILKSINWKQIYEGVKSFGKGLDWVAKKIGGWENVMVAAVIFMNRNFVLAVANVVKPSGAARCHHGRADCHCWGLYRGRCCHQGVFGRLRGNPDRLDYRAGCCNRLPGLFDVGGARGHCESLG